MSWTSSAGDRLRTNLKVERGRQDHTHCCGCKQLVISERNARRGRLISPAFAAGSPNDKGSYRFHDNAANAGSIRTPSGRSRMSHDATAESKGGYAGRLRFLDDDRLPKRPPMDASALLCT